MSPARKHPRTHTAEADLDFRRSEVANRPPDGIRFSGVRAALRWYFERSETLTSPQGMHPRTYQTRTGERVLLSVDGGKGGDFDDVLATVTTIGLALTRLKQHEPHAHKVLMLAYADKLSQKQIAERFNANQTTISRWKGTAETFLAGALAADVLRPLA